MEEPAPVFWPHAPPHFLLESGTYMVTASTFRKELHFASRKRLRFLTELLLKTAESSGWRIEAWAVLANHYHWIGKSPQDGAQNLTKWASKVHRESAKFINELDGVPERKVWHNFFDSNITYPQSYFARLHYVNQNPVHHGVVTDARIYPWCSAAWFETNASEAFQKTLQSFKIDRLKVFEP